MYHGFTAKTLHEGIENCQDKHLNIDNFRSHIEYLRRHYNVISLDRLVQYHANGKSIPDRSVVLTFDDGYRSNYALAYPILKQYAVPATIFLTTAFIDRAAMLWTDRIEYAISATQATDLRLQLGSEVLSFTFHDTASKKVCNDKIRSRLKATRQEPLPAIVASVEDSLGHSLQTDQNIPDIYRPLEWREVLEMMESGLISIGSHTVTHQILTRCSPVDANTEVCRSKQRIERETGSACTLFCYPNGRVGDFDGQTKRLLRESGYSCGVTTVGGMNDKDSDVFELKRLIISGKGDLVRFAMTLSGVVGLLDGVKQSVLQAFGRRGR